MPVVTKCPSCERTVRVPDNLIGSKVRCPQCKNVFTAEAPDEPKSRPPAAAPRPASPVTERPSKPPSRPPAGPVTDRPSRPPKRAPEPDEEPEEEEMEESPEEEPEERQRPRRRRSKSRDRALGMVAGPGIALMIIGILGIVGGIAILVLAMLVGGLIAAQPGLAAPQPGVPPGMQGGSPMLGVAQNLVSGIGSIIFGSIMTYGGMQMKSLRSRGWARTASIIAVIPCITCCLYGLPIGIWSLRVLGRPEVADAFDS